MDKDAIIGKLRQQKGRAGAVAQALVACKEGDWYERREARETLSRLLLQGSPQTLAAVFDNGPRELFTVIHGKRAADWAGEAAGRLNLYVHSPSSYRRSFRTKEVKPYIDRFISVLDSIFFSWEDFDLVKDLTSPPDADSAGRAWLGTMVYGDFLAARLDAGDKEAAAAVKDIILGDNNTKLLSDAIINGILKSADEELHRLLEGTLLAARLQEGLRQSILENADNGRVEAFIGLMKVVLDNDLLRYSSAVRALDVWMGLGETYDDKRVAAKLLTLGYTYLTDAQALAAGAASADVTEIYAALWAASVREMNVALTLIDKLLNGAKYQKLVALYFLAQTENSALQSFAAARLLGETDLDVLSLVFTNYLTGSFSRYQTAEIFGVKCREHEILADGAARDRQFEALLAMTPLVPAKGYLAQGKPFPWHDLSLSPGDLFSRILTVAGYDFDPKKTARLLEIMPGADPDNRAAFIRFFLADPREAKGRAFVFTALNDKSMSVRTQALSTVTEFSQQAGLAAEEGKAVAALLALKTGDIRQSAVKILLGMGGERPVEAAKALLADKNENMRLGGLDMLTQLVKTEKLDRAAATEFCALMPKMSDRERVLVDSLGAAEEKYGPANGFGLYDPAYIPDFPFPAVDKKHRLEQIFGAPGLFEGRHKARITKIFDALCELIKANRDYTYKIYSYDGDKETALGGLTWPRARAEANDDENLTPFEKFVLPEVWRGWIKDNAVTFSEIILFRFMESVEDYMDVYEPDYRDETNAVVEKLFRAKETNKLNVYCHGREYGEMARHIIQILGTEYAEDERFAALYGALADIAAKVAAEEWKRPIYEENDRSYGYGRRKDCTFADTKEVTFFMSELRKAAGTDEHFLAYTGLCFTLGRLSDMFYVNMNDVDVARAVEAGIVKIDAMYRTVFLGNANCIRNYAGKIRWERTKKIVEQYPVLKKTADEGAARVIEIELKRGDSATEVSALALEIGWHEGADTFAQILVAMGKETFVRGYIYSSGDPTKKIVLSSLLKASRPGPEEGAAALREALAGRIADKRLIEAAMYAPAWIGPVSDYLGWPGLQSAVWYFHAHVNDSFSAEKETEVARYSPITPEEFNDGAFDVAWFKDAHATLGEERFALVYDCAKYLTDGANHRRAQLFADAVLGKLDTAALWREIHEKRNKDKLLSYALIPLKKGKEQQAAMERYENIQLFLKESKTFGAQRRASEGKACAIALENLARNAGFANTLRFTWRMEILKVESLGDYFTGKTIGEYQVRVAVRDGGEAALICEKNGKTLASVPGALKKDPYVLECKESVTALKAQYRRARENLELVMVNRDVFPFGEIKALMQHPVVAPLLTKLVFVTLDEGGAAAASGLYAELAERLGDGAQVRLAHPFDLYTLGTWRDCQRYAFEQKLVQPFKQIFRELYLLNEDEREAGTVSRRYAGHQVQPKKTVALLKSRLWTVDYETGLQRVYFRENIYVKLYAAADWFSPADIEAPTLETVEFFDRKTHEAIPLEKIPPVIFSEIMRDIDLVVSVAHVGGVDPEASLSTVEMRAVIVAELLRLLHIENVSVEGRHAKITGKLGEYTVHLGSAQVHKMGRGAVNILAVPSQHRGRVFLPFADDDPRTAEVMSKIILLAEDKTIKDPAILAQIG
ncbi:MAG: DUF4132 domain-containing protein [Gracilibacteraceae bacterium]|jgi:hypothetical protein|nr:DUF4132 domain-containing protein [Gracilibacteraceae bacterium]